MGQNQVTRRVIIQSEINRLNYRIVGAADLESAETRYGGAQTINKQFSPS
jgi:hypothetical protein